MGDEATIGFLVPCFWFGIFLSIFPWLCAYFAASTGAFIAGVWIILAIGAGLLVMGLVYTICCAQKSAHSWDVFWAVNSFMGLALIAETGLFLFVNAILEVTRAVTA